jgi:hypothetical protein
MTKQLKDHPLLKTPKLYYIMKKQLKDRPLFKKRQNYIIFVKQLKEIIHVYYKNV